MAVQSAKVAAAPKLALKVRQGGSVPELVMKRAREGKREFGRGKEFRRAGSHDVSGSSL